MGNKFLNYKVWESFYLNDSLDSIKNEVKAGKTKRRVEGRGREDKRKKSFKFRSGEKI